MARVSDLRRKVDSGSRVRQLAATSMLLETLDAYELKKTDQGISLTAYIHLYKKEFTTTDLFNLAQPLGEWLCSLPKGIWTDKINKQ